MPHSFVRACLRGLVTVGVLTTLSAAPAFAQYKGDHLPGNAGLQAGSQPPPGIYVGNLLWVYPTDTIKDDDGNTINSGRGSLTSRLNGILVSWVTNVKLAGGNLGGSVALPFIANRIERNFLEVDTGFAYTDMILQPIQLGWHRPRYDMLAAYSLYLPTGKYDANGNDNSGLGMIGQELSFGTTGFFDERRHWHGAGLVSHEWHTKKNDLDLRVGQVLTVEGGFGRTFYKNVGHPLPLITNIGVVAYHQRKITEDEGTAVPPALRGVKDEVFGIGPEVNVFIPQARLTIIGRVLPEFGAHTRTQGTTVSFTIVFAAKSLMHAAP